MVLLEKLLTQQPLFAPQTLCDNYQLATLASAGAQYTFHQEYTVHNGFLS